MRLNGIRYVAVIVTVAMGIALFRWPVEHAQALNGFIDPNGDGAVGAWATTGTNRFTEIDEAIRQPTTPTISDNVSANASTGGSLNLRMSSITGAVTSTDVRVWIYHNDGANGLISVQLFDDDETTTRSGSVNLTYSSTNAWHSVLFSGLALTQGQLDTLTVRVTASKSGGGKAGTITVYALYADVTYSNATPVFDQSSYRLFNSVDSRDVGTPLAAQDIGGVLNASGDAFRLRMLLHVTSANLATSGQSFKLQFVDRGTGSCSSPSGGTPSTYTDLTTGTIMAYDNLVGGVNDGDALTANANDPVHSGHTTRNQTIEEANNFSNTQAAVNIGEDGMWDFALIDNGAPAATTYCFRAVKSDNTPMASYTVYPQITTGNGVLSVDIVDGGGTPVATPSFAMTTSGYLFTCDTSTTNIGSASQMVRISNYTATPSWTVSIAATTGNTSLWSDGGTGSYDYNDPGGVPAGCADSGDTDSDAGQLGVNPSVGTSTPRTGCTNTGVTLGSSSAYNEAVIDSITLISAGSTASVGCWWDVTGVGSAQKIPADQSAGNYSINLTLTATAI